MCLASQILVTTLIITSAVVECKWFKNIQGVQLKIKSCFVILEGLFCIYVIAFCSKKTSCVLNMYIFIDEVVISNILITSIIGAVGTSSQIPIEIDIIQSKFKL